MAKNTGYSGKRGIAAKPKLKTGGTTVRLGRTKPASNGSSGGK